MKKISVLAMAVFALSGCAAPKLTHEQNLVRSISESNGCEFLTAAYMESRPQTLQHYLKIQTDRKGGNAYKLISTSNTVVMGSNVVMANYEVYKCL